MAYSVSKDMYAVFIAMIFSAGFESQFERSIHFYIFTPRTYLFFVRPFFPQNGKYKYSCWWNCKIDRRCEFNLELWRFHTLLTRYMSNSNSNQSNLIKHFAQTLHDLFRWRDTNGFIWKQKKINIDTRLYFHEWTLSVLCHCQMWLISRELQIEMIFYHHFTAIQWNSN